MQYFVTARGGEALNTVVSLGIALAIINAVVAITLQGGRTLFGSARDRAYPDRISRLFGYVHPRLQTPLPATLFVGGCAAVVAAIVPLGALITATGATLMVLYLLVAVSAIVGRRNGTTAHAKYRMPAWPLAPVLIIAALGYVTYQLWIGNPLQVLIAVGALAVGYAYYYAYLYKRRADRWTMPDAPADEHALLGDERARDELAGEEPGGLLAGPALELDIPTVEGPHTGREMEGR
jgi:amino acid transporter